MKVLWKITAWLYRTSLLPYCNLESWHFDSISWSPIKPASALMLLLPLTISKVKSHGKLWCGWENTCINVFINGVWRWSSSVVSDSLGSHDAYQASPSMGFSRQEYRSGLPFPSPGAPPDPGIEPTSLASSALTHKFFTTAPPGKPQIHNIPLHNVIHCNPI